MDSQNTNLRILVLPESKAIHQALPALIQCMVRSVANYVKACRHQRIPDFIRRIECRIPGNSKFLTTDNDLLIH